MDTFNRKFVNDHSGSARNLSRVPARHSGHTKILSSRTTIPIFVLSLILPFALSGCLLGLGAAAGATVGGCSVLDENEDERVTRAELSRGLFDAWDTDDNDVLTQAEFEGGVDRRDTFDTWSENFDDWDANGDDSLTEAEFDAGVAQDDAASAWLDDQCDDLGL